MIRQTIGMFTVPISGFTATSRNYGAGGGNRTPDPLITNQDGLGYPVDSLLAPLGLPCPITPVLDAISTVNLTVRQSPLLIVKQRPQRNQQLTDSACCLSHHSGGSDLSTIQNVIQKSGVVPNA